MPPGEPHRHGGAHEQEGPPRRGGPWQHGTHEGIRAHRWLDLALALALLVLAAVGSLRWFDTTSQLLVVLQTAGPLVAIGLLVLAGATVLLRRWWMLLPVGAVLAVAATMALPPYFSSASPDAKRDLTVMAVNLDFGEAAAPQVMDAVRARAVDVLVATEITPDALGQLDEAGLGKWFPNEAGESRPDSFTGTMVFSRFPLTVVTGDDPVDEPTQSLQPEVVIDVGGRPLRLKAVHVTAPVGRDIGSWQAGLNALTTWRDRQPANEAFLLAGDFNAGGGHPAFRTLAEGLDSAHRVAGLGWMRTWPIVGRRMPPYTQIDHLLSRRLTVIDAGEVAIHGTDHAVIWAAYSIKSQ